MPIYFITDVNITDPEGYEEYRKIVDPSIRKYGGKFVLVTNRLVETIEGDWQPTHLVVVEFDNLEKAKQWYASPEYAPALQIRKKTAEAQTILME